MIIGWLARPGRSRGSGVPNRAAAVPRALVTGPLTTLMAALVGLALIGWPARIAQAQSSDAGSGMNGGGSMMPPVTSGPDEPDRPTAVPQIPLMQPITGTMMATPPYGNAPLRVGFFVLATDPENLGFLTYQWNFGDGTVSALPPELYIFHTYQDPGNYVCTLIAKTVDGRSITLLQAVIVKPLQD